MSQPFYLDLIILRRWIVNASFFAVKRIRCAKFIGVNIKDYPNLDNWLKRIMARPETHKGLGVPEWFDPDA